jgi:hypothetical protein
MLAAAARLARPLVVPVKRAVGLGGRRAVAGGAQKVAGVAGNPLVQTAAGGLIGGIPGAIATPIAGKFMGPAGAAVTAVAAKPVAQAVNQGIVQPVVGAVSSAQATGGRTLLGEEAGDPAAMLRDAAAARRQIREEELNMYQDPRYLAEQRRLTQEVMDLNNQTGQIRGSLNRDQYLANTITQGMADMGAMTRTMMQSKNPYVQSF